MIRPYRSEDFAAIDAWWQHGIDTYERPSKRWSEFVLSAENVTCICEIAGDEIRGFAQYDVYDADAWVGIVVSPAHRRKGVAAALLKAVELRAMDENIRRISVSIEPTNHPALSLVTSRRFTFAGEEEGFLLYELNI